MSRPYDIVVVGATGYSGRKVCIHLSNAADGYKWAIAGRDPKKLAALSKDLKLSPDVGVLVADTSDKDSLDVVCRSSSVVIACAGPFDKVGMPVVEACVKNGTHYCDITGEFQYFRKMIETYEAVAMEKKVMLVPCCGIDCVPSDLGNWLVHEAARCRNTEVRSVTGYFSGLGAPSGGTMASIANLFQTMEKKDFNPASLTPANAPRVPAPSTRWIHYAADVKRWIGPYIMAGINERVVRRSNALAGHISSYVEASVGTLPKVLAGTLGLYVFGVLLAIPPIRSLLCKYVFPAQGTGPTDEQNAKGFFKAHFVGTTTKGEKIEAMVKDHRDGYTATGIFAASCGMVAADMVRRGCVSTGGVLTASTAFGADLCDRLRAAGMTFEVVEKDSSSFDERKRK